jgi:ribosomal protein S27AE
MNRNTVSFLERDWWGYECVRCGGGLYYHFLPGSIDRVSCGCCGDTVDRFSYKSVMLAHALEMVVDKDQ